MEHQSTIIDYQEQIEIDLFANTADELYHDDKDYKRQFGAFFTPLAMAIAIVEKDLFEDWTRGLTILDPTAGEGVFLEALICVARKRGIVITDSMLHNLYGVELNPDYVQNFYTNILEKYSIMFPADNFVAGDIFFTDIGLKADRLVGNPPWVNFCDLNEEYKQCLKPIFRYYGLVKNAKDLLLGCSRTDIASLVISKVLYSNLREGGKACFIMPLSIFLNDGANQGFRNYNVKGVDFCVDEIFDFNGTQMFDDILTRYCTAYFIRDLKQSFPIRYNILCKGNWETRKAQPLFNLTDPLTVFENEEAQIRLSNFERIKLPKRFMPRQGVNTCGANDLFFFSKYRIVDENFVELSNKNGETVKANKQFVYPLAVSSTLAEDTRSPAISKLVLIPHIESGKPMDLDELKRNENLYRYLLAHKSTLESRKGVLINTWIKKGYWYALMGIGPYCFLKYKIMWKAFGDSIFSPKILYPDAYFGTWQGNQSLNAYIGIDSLEDLRNIYDKLKNPLIQEYLESSRMQGTCNWAQPGRIKKIMEFV